MLEADRKRGLRALLRTDDGGVAIEFAFVSFALVLVSLATVEFGRALEARNQIALVADKLAREVLNDSEVTLEEIEDRYPDLLGTLKRDLVEIEASNDVVEVGGRDYREVSVSYPFVFLIPKLVSPSITLTVSQRVPVT